MPRRNVSTEERELIEKARRHLPAGSLGHPVTDVLIRAGRGSRVWDVSGNEYVDYLLGSGPMLLGHAHPEVVEAVEERNRRGTTFFANNEHAILLAEAIVHAVPCTEKVRFSSTGTEATLYAMRAVRALQEARQDLEVRRRLPWNERLRTDERIPIGPSGTSAPISGLGRHPPIGPGRDADRSIQRHRDDDRHHRA